MHSGRSLLGSTSDEAPPRLDVRPTRAEEWQPIGSGDRHLRAYDAIVRMAETRVLSRRRLEELFPGADIYVELMLGIPKSHAAYPPG